MKVSISIDRVGDSLDAKVNALLEDANLPTCMGNMIPLLLARVITVDEKNVFKHKDSVLDEEVVMGANELVVESSSDKQSGLKDNYVLTNEGLDYIENYKEERSRSYVERLLACSICDKTDVCYKLTKNYLKMIELERRYKD